MDHWIGCHTCAFIVAYAVLWLEVLPHSSAVKVFHWGEGRLPQPFFGNQRKSPGFEKKALICPFWAQIYHLRQFLSKCPNLKKPPPPWTTSSCAPAYIRYKQSGFCSLELYWQYLQKSWWSSGMIPEKVTRVRFPGRINTVYSKLPPINDLFFLNQT